MKLEFIPLLTWITGLAVYVGSIRFVVIRKLMDMGSGGDSSQKNSYKMFLRLLIPVDLVLLAAGAALFLHIFWISLFGGAAPAWLLPIVSWCSFIALLLLIAHHAFSWYRTLFK